MWHFRKKTAGEKVRNPIQGEFFAQDAIAAPAQALVRESVQNSLDASDGRGAVRVCLTLAVGPDALPPSRIRNLFDGAWEHYAARDNGLHAAPTPSSRCPYLLIEDYCTNGLTGDPEQCDPDPSPSVKNPFFLFFRAEGLSGKTGGELGRWGVGKFVFPRSSLASSHFGVTVRADDHRRLLLGAATLKAHRIGGSSEMYTPDGLYGRLGVGDFVHPIEDPQEIDRFCHLFAITRAEPGLSVVVPFIDEAEITYDMLLRAAARDYFFPILSGRLEMTIREGARSETLSRATLPQALRNDQELSSEIQPLLSLSELATTVLDKDRVHLEMPNPHRAACWEDALVGPVALKALKEKLQEGEPAAVRVPVTVRSKADSDRQSFFDLYLKRDHKSDGRPIFVREGIIISDVRGPRAREVRSIVMIEDKPLSGMLGDSENPAHTQWQKDSSNFKGKYTYGKAVIEFVTKSVRELLAIVDRSSDEADPSLTIDFFSIEPRDDDEDSDEARQPTRPDKSGSETRAKVIQIPKRPPSIRIERVEGGFAVVPGQEPPAVPYMINVRCAYETRTGNSLKHWDAADFTLGGAGLLVRCEGDAHVLNAARNQFTLRVSGGAFRAVVDGFDTNRDVFVRAELGEV